MGESWPESSDLRPLAMCCLVLLVTCALRYRQMFDVFVFFLFFF